MNGMSDEKKETYRVTFLCNGNDVEDWRRQVGDGEAEIYDDNLHEAD